MSDPPQNWRSAKLAETGTWLSGGTPFTDEPLYWNGDIPWISAASLKDFNISHADRAITPLGARAGTRLIPPGTVLFVVRGMSLKKELRVGITERQVAFGQDCKAIVPNPGIHGRFLAFAIKARSNDILCMVDEAGHGTGRLPTDLIAKLPVGIPEFAEQQRISEILDVVDERIHLSINSVSKLEKLRIAAIRESMLLGLECYRHVEASELHADSHRSIGSWRLVPLGSLLSRIDAGRSPDLEDTPAGSGQWGVLKVSAVGNGAFRPEENKVVHDHALYNPAICVRPGDFLMTRANTTQLVGLSCVVEHAPPHLMLCDKTLRLKFTHPYAVSRFVHVVLGINEIRRQIEIEATGTSGSMKNISQQAIRRLMIPLGSVDDIERVTRVDASFKAQLDSMRREVEQLQALKQGLMDDMLTGRVRVTGGAMGTG
jgi:restriction endonuclease S subunit